MVTGDQKPPGNQNCDKKSIELLLGGEFDFKDQDARLFDHQAETAQDAACAGPQALRAIAWTQGEIDAYP